jgi:hypothetical protein
MKEVKPLSVDEIIKLDNELEIEGFELIPSVSKCTGIASIGETIKDLNGNYYYLGRFTTTKTIYSHFLTRVIEAINRNSETVWEFYIYVYHIEIWGHADLVEEMYFTNYESIDDAKTSAIRKYLEVVR